MKPVFYLFLQFVMQTLVFGQGEIPPNIRSVAVLVQFKNSSGSGFYLQDSASIYFISAYHVIFEVEKQSLHEDTVSLISYRENVENDPKIILNVSLKDVLQMNIKFDRSNDIVAIKIADLKSIDTLGYKEIFYMPYVHRVGGGPTKISSWQMKYVLKFGDVDAGSDIYIIGYPKSLGLEGNFDIDRPLFRKGIVAGKDVAHTRIIGDGAVYFGNSGGIVVGLGGPDQYFKLIGIISQYIPFNDILYDSRGVARSVDSKNSGYSVIIPADKILNVIRGF